MATLVFDIETSACPLRILMKFNKVPFREAEGFEQIARELKRAEIRLV
jgi:hypothetical protein